MGHQGADALEVFMKKNCKDLIDYPRGTRWGDFDSQAGEDGCQRQEDKTVSAGCLKGHSRELCKSGAEPGVQGT